MAKVCVKELTQNIFRFCCLSWLFWPSLKALAAAALGQISRVLFPPLGTQSRMEPIRISTYVTTHTRTRSRILREKAPKKIRKKQKSTLEISNLGTTSLRKVLNSSLLPGLYDIDPWDAAICSKEL